MDTTYTTYEYECGYCHTIEEIDTDAIFMNNEEQLSTRSTDELIELLHENSINIVDPEDYDEVFEKCIDVARKLANQGEYLGDWPGDKCCTYSAGAYHSLVN